jgi:hypothetical protein
MLIDPRRWPPSSPWPGNTRVRFGARNVKAGRRWAAIMDLVDSVSYTLRHGGPPTWERRWRKMLSLRARIEALYRGAQTVGNNEDAEMSVEDFSVAAFHLAEHLASDTSLPQAVRDQARDQTAKGILKVAGDMANTDKHHTRTGGPTVRVSQFSSGSGPGGLSMSLTSVPATGPSTNYDALAFATDCVEAWRAFLTSHGVAIPAPN